MSLETIIEGRTRLVVPYSGKGLGPAAKARIFYNPAMRCNRDISVLFARSEASGMNVLDALGGTGAKGIRIANETEKNLEVQVNDLCEEAFSIIKKNIKANKLENASASNLEFNALLSNSGFDWIEIDPYGSPVKFLDLAVRRLSRGGILSISATDTAPLCGAKPEACQRRYMARPLNSGCCHEFGLRIMVGNAVRRAAALDYGLEPLLAYYHGHYFRAYFLKNKGAQAANASLKKVGYVQWDGKDGYSLSGKIPEGTYAGPLWTGELWDPYLVNKVAGQWDDSMNPESKKLLNAISREEPLPPWHYHMDEVASIAGKHPMKTDSMVEALKSKGFSASGVHYNRKGFKTNAGLKEILSTLK